MGVEEEWILEEYPSFDLSRIRHPPAEELNLERCAGWLAACSSFVGPWLRQRGMLCSKLGILAGTTWRPC